MSVRVMRDVWKCATSNPSDRLVLLALADFANDAGEAWPKVAVIADRCGLSERSVYRSMNALEAQGHIRRGRTGRGEANSYMVTPVCCARGGEGGTATDGPDILSPTPPDRMSGGTPDILSASNFEAPDILSGGDLPLLADPKDSKESLEPPDRTIMSQIGRSATLDDSDAAETSTPPPVRDDVEELCSFLAASVNANSFRKAKITAAWRNDMRLLLDRDKVPFSEAFAVLRWSQQDSFWCGNIRSPKKFRAQFDTLRAQMRRKGVKPSSDRKSVEEWVSECWRKGDTKSIAARCGLEFQVPDIPDGVADVPTFVATARKRWIKSNAGAIVDTIMRREA